MTASGPSGAAITAACSAVGSGSRSSLASCIGLYVTVLTKAFQQMPLTFRGGLADQAAGQPIKRPVGLSNRGVEHPAGTDHDRRQRPGEP